MSTIKIKKKHPLLNPFLWGIFFLCHCAMVAQISITDAQVSGITNAAEGDLYLTSDTNRLFIGQQLGTLWEIGTSGNGGSSNSWLLSGNTSLGSSNFIGSISDNLLELRSNNLPILQIGRRQTLGLTESITDYNDNNQPLVFLKGGW